MTTFRYLGPEPRYYPDRGLFASAGDVLDLTGDAPDDGRWEAADDAAPTAAPDVQAAEAAVQAAEDALAVAETGAHSAPEDPNAAPAQEG